VAGFIQLQLVHAFVRVTFASVKLLQFACDSALSQMRKVLHLAWGKRKHPQYIIRIG
jgi:hypothetical protein